MITRRANTPIMIHVSLYLLRSNAMTRIKHIVKSENECSELRLTTSRKFVACALTTQYMLPRSPRTGCNTQLVYGTRERHASYTNALSWLLSLCCRCGTAAAAPVCCYCLRIVLCYSCAVPGASIFVFCVYQLFVFVSVLIGCGRFVTSLCTRNVSDPACFHTKVGDARRALCDTLFLSLPLVAAAASSSCHY